MPSDRRLWYVEEKHAVTFCPLTLLQIWHNKRMMCTERNKKVTVKRISVTAIIGNYKVSQHYEIPKCSVVSVSTKHDISAHLSSDM